MRFPRSVSPDIWHR